MILKNIYLHARNQSGLLVRYAISGGLGAAIQTITLYVWVSILNWEKWYLFGAVFGFTLALITSFILQKYWTFRDRVTHRTKQQFIWYASVAVGNVLISVSLLAGAKSLFTYFGIDFFNGWYLVVQIIAVSFASFMSFLANYFITFKETRVPSSISTNE